MVTANDIPFTELRGLALPALRTAGGYFASKSAHDVAWGDLMLTLFCPIGGRAGRRDYGSALMSRIFEPNVEALAQDIEFDVRDAAARHTPHITILDVKIVQTQTLFQMSIAFRLTDDAPEAAEQRLVELNRKHVVRLISGLEL